MNRRSIYIFAIIFSLMYILSCSDSFAAGGGSDTSCPSQSDATLSAPGGQGEPSISEAGEAPGGAGEGSSTAYANWYDKFVEWWKNNFGGK